MSRPVNAEDLSRIYSLTLAHPASDAEIEAVRRLARMNGYDIDITQPVWHSISGRIYKWDRVWWWHQRGEEVYWVGAMNRGTALEAIRGKLRELGVKIN